MRGRGWVVVMVVAAMVTGVTAVAQAAVPGDVLYPLKRLSEQVWLVLHPGDDSTILRTLVDRRISEARRRPWEAARVLGDAASVAARLPEDLREAAMDAVTDAADALAVPDVVPPTPGPPGERGHPDRTATDTGLSPGQRGSPTAPRGASPPGPPPGRRNGGQRPDGTPNGGKGGAPSAPGPTPGGGRSTEQSGATPGGGRSTERSGGTPGGGRSTERPGATPGHGSGGGPSPPGAAPGRGSDPGHGRSGGAGRAAPSAGRAADHPGHAASPTA